MAVGDENIESSFTQVMSYVVTSASVQHTVTNTDDNIVTGELYSFKFRAKNSKGYSEFSNLVTIAAVDVPT